jgi:PST family polysaccharide transporter
MANFPSADHYVASVLTTSTELVGTDEGSSPSLLRNTGSLLAGQAVSMVVPLLTVPYVARVLGPAAWGPVLAAQALGVWLILVLEFGFELSGARAVAQSRLSASELREIVHGVQSAKALLTLVAFAVVCAAAFHERDSRINFILLWWTFAFAVLRGFSPLWFYQGIERVHAAVAIDTGSRTVASLLVFLVVHGPADGWKVIALQAVFAGISLILLTLWLSRQVELRTPDLRAAITTLRQGGIIFACRAWSGLYIQANTLVLSALAGPAVVAFFGGAERLIRTAISTIQPLTQAFLPRLSFLQTSDPEAARRLRWRSLLAVGSLGVCIGAAAFLGAPILVHVLLGPKYEPAIPVLRMLGVLPLLVAVNTVLGLYWALPSGRDRTFLAAVVLAGITNVTLAVFLVPRWGALGMAVSASAAEVMVLACLGAVYAHASRSRGAAS